MRELALSSGANRGGDAEIVETERYPLTQKKSLPAAQEKKTLPLISRWEITVFLYRLVFLSRLAYSEYSSYLRFYEHCQFWSKVKAK